MIIRHKTKIIALTLTAVLFINNFQAEKFQLFLYFILHRSI